MIVYFAEPIDQDRADADEASLRAALVRHIVSKGWGVYRPATAWTLGRGDQVTALTVETTNRAALDEADVIVARLPEGTPSIGVPMEIEYATRTLGIPAVVIGAQGVALLGNPLVWSIKDDELNRIDGVLNDVAALVGPSRRKLRHTGFLAPRNYEGDAGIDLVTSEETVIPAKGYGRIPTGNRIEIPQGMFGWVVARSSTFKNWGFLVLPGIIDEGFTGELFAVVYNTSDGDVVVNKGDRVCQFILFKNRTREYQPTQVDTIEGARGENGFGSTGKTRLGLVQAE